MDDQQLLRTAIESNVAFTRTLGTAAGSTVVDRGAVVASIVSRVPERSVVNAVAYSDAGALAAAYGDLERAYAERGIEAWTVWVPTADRDSASLLAERGHLLDGDPHAMAAELSSLELGADTAAVEPGSDWGLLGRLNDAAYGWPGSFERAFERLPADAARLYFARLDGEVAAGLLVQDHGTDAEINFVATLEHARGRGLATALLTRGLREARERGLETTTLFATRAGAPVYERLGYRMLGAMEMWERRG